MERLTKASDNGTFYSISEDKIWHDTNGFSGEAVERLAKFENFYYDLVIQQNEISQELEKLRNAGRTNSVKFRELMTNKLINTNILILLKKYGLQK